MDSGWEPAVYMSCMSQNFRLFHVPNLSVRNFRFFLLMYAGSWSAGEERKESASFFIGVFVFVCNTYLLCVQFE